MLGKLSKYISAIMMWVDSTVVWGKLIDSVEPPRTNYLLLHSLCSTCALQRAQLSLSKEREPSHFDTFLKRQMSSADLL